MTLGVGNHQSVTAGLPTSYVVTQTEDERNFTLPAFGGDDMRDQRKMRAREAPLASTNPAPANSTVSELPEKR